MGIIWLRRPRFVFRVIQSNLHVDCVPRISHKTQCSGNFIKYAPYAPIEYRDEVNHPYTAEKVIVELDNGRVVTVDPRQIRFTPEKS